MAWEVQHHAICQGWINTWSEEVDGVSRPLIYPSEAEAQYELQEFLREITEEIAYGERDPDNGYDAEEFRVVEVADPADL
jgi:hypothetical protein